MIILVIILYYRKALNRHANMCMLLKIATTSELLDNISTSSVVGI